MLVWDGSCDFGCVKGRLESLCEAVELVWVWHDGGLCEWELVEPVRACRACAIVGSL